MCHRLHTNEPPSHHEDIPKWFAQSGKCINVQKDMFKGNAWKKIINDTEAKKTNSRQKNATHR